VVPANDRPPRVSGSREHHKNQAFFAANTEPRHLALLANWRGSNSSQIEKSTAEATVFVKTLLL